MYLEPASLNHLGELPRDTARLDAGLLQPRVLERLARNLPTLRELTLLVDDPGALDGPPLPSVRRLRLVRAHDVAGLWPRLTAAFPGLRRVDLLDPVRLVAADLKGMAAHGLEGIGLYDPPPESVAALDGWPNPDRFTLAAADPAPWLERLDADRIARLAVHTEGPAAGLIVDRFAGPVLHTLTLRGATDVDGARLAELTGLQALTLAGAGRVDGLRGLTGLRRLELDGGPGPDALELARLRHLERLAVRGSERLDGGGLALLVGLPRLAWLDVSDSPALTATDLMIVQTAPAPAALALRGVAVSGGLMHLRGLGIRHLDLRRCALDADDFVELAAMGGLVRLDLDLLAWSVDRPHRAALLAAHPEALAHYAYTCTALPDGALEETVRDVDRPWCTRTRVEGADDP